MKMAEESSGLIRRIGELAFCSRSGFDHWTFVVITNWYVSYGSFNRVGFSDIEHSVHPNRSSVRRTTAFSRLGGIMYTFIKNLEKKQPFGQTGR